ncbi:clathrin-coated vesicle protein [Pseudohyphozyma bogoriensis]|nr:clathrin-coated vesicle protein [Pseudohyphozyma bogoriensis]
MTARRIVSSSALPSEKSEAKKPSLAASRSPSKPSGAAATPSTARKTSASARLPVSPTPRPPAPRPVIRKQTSTSSIPISRTKKGSSMSISMSSVDEEKGKEIVDEKPKARPMGLGVGGKATRPLPRSVSATISGGAPSVRRELHSSTVVGGTAGLRGKGKEKEQLEREKENVASQPSVTSTSRPPSRTLKPSTSSATSAYTSALPPLSSSTTSTTSSRRRSSWETLPGSGRPSLAAEAPVPFPSSTTPAISLSTHSDAISAPAEDVANASWETVDRRISSISSIPPSTSSFDTPQKPDSNLLPSRAAMSYSSPSPTSFANLLAASTNGHDTSPLLNTQTSLLSPTPRPRTRVLALSPSIASLRKSHPRENRESASLEEMLKMSLAGALKPGNGAAEDGWLVDDEVSAVMRREMDGVNFAHLGLEDDDSGRRTSRLGLVAFEEVSSDDDDDEMGKGVEGGILPSELTRKAKSLDSDLARKREADLEAQLRQRDEELLAVRMEAIKKDEELSGLLKELDIRQVTIKRLEKENVHLEGDAEEARIRYEKGRAGIEHGKYEARIVGAQTKGDFSVCSQSWVAVESAVKAEREVVASQLEMLQAAWRGLAAWDGLV